MHTRQRITRLNDYSILIALALVKLVVHLLINGQYGLHRDELAMLDDAQHIAWGHVNYLPFTPLVECVALEWFRLLLVGVRFFAGLAQSAAMVVTGLMARELGEDRPAQIVAAVAVAIASMSLFLSAVFQYSSFDYLWWVLNAYFVVRLLKSGDARWWLAIGLGMMTKTTMAFWTAGIVSGVLLTSTRCFLTSF